MRRFLPIGQLLIPALLLAACSRQPVYPPPALSATEAVLDFSALREDVPQFFTYRYHGSNISFFVIRSNGRVVSFLDACASCYPHKRGYRYRDGAVTCRYCNMEFPLFRLEKGLGGCYPIKVEGRLEGGKYRIPLSALQKEEAKF